MTVVVVVAVAAVEAMAVVVQAAAVAQQSPRPLPCEAPVLQASTVVAVVKVAVVVEAAAASAWTDWPLALLAAASLARCGARTWQPDLLAFPYFHLLGRMFLSRQWVSWLLPVHLQFLQYLSHSCY